MTCWGGFSPASASASNPQPGKTKRRSFGSGFFCLKFVAGDDLGQANEALVGSAHAREEAITSLTSVDITPL